MTRKVFIKKRAYLVGKLLDWQKTHDSEATPEMIKKANKSRFSKVTPFNSGDGSIVSYQEAYDRLYDVLKIFVEEA